MREDSLAMCLIEHPNFLQRCLQNHKPAVNRASCLTERGKTLKNMQTCENVRSRFPSIWLFRNVICHSIIHTFFCVKVGEWQDHKSRKTHATSKRRVTWYRCRSRFGKFNFANHDTTSSTDRGGEKRISSSPLSWTTFKSLLAPPAPLHFPTESRDPTLCITKRRDAPLAMATCNSCISPVRRPSSAQIPSRPSTSSSPLR